jgi:hypothetical protein
VEFDCNENPTYESVQANGGEPDGCGNPIALFFFISFLLMVTFVFLNLFIAIILEGKNKI